MRKTLKTKKVKRATSKKARPVKHLTAAQREMREQRKAERQALADYNAEQRYCGLIALQKTWRLPRFVKLAKLASKYLRKLNETLNTLRTEYAWLNK